MKKLLLLICAGALLFTIGCKKQDQEVAPQGNGSWTLAGVSYKANVTYKGPTSHGEFLINFWESAPTADLKVNSLALSFKEDPTTSGTYQLVGYGTTLSGKQFTLAAGTKEGLAYAYIGATNIDVTITVTGGKAKVVIPEITLKGASGQADAKLSASVQEM
ncbi:hypothetical protein [Mucilaginibacter antarcticus]|uniref:Lipocalin-like protein n=1 Tax=Mucilaginibacter antarcticus TaxID=1855725 RepID=A0ABW5XJW9_9SPHI